MAFSDYQNTYAWQMALELSPILIQLAEELPASEHNGLAMTLRSLAVDLPTTVGIDIQNGSVERNSTLIRLQSTLELIDRIYPALDIAMADKALAERLERFTGASFAEPIASPSEVISSVEPTVEPEDNVEPENNLEDEPVSAPSQLDQPLEPNPAAEPSLGATSDDPDTSGTHISLTPQSIPVIAQESANVSPNSQQ